MNQLCQAFNVQNLNQLQKLLPYQPTTPQPPLSRTRQQTYYENDLMYIAEASEDSSLENSDQGGLVHHQSAIRSQASEHRRTASTDVRALLIQREKPFRGK